MLTRNYSIELMIVICIMQCGNTEGARLTWVSQR